MRRKRVLMVAVVVQLVVAALAIGFLPKNDSKRTSPAAALAEPALSGNEGLLYGVVTDEETNKPIAGAVITIDHATGPTTVRTGSEGRYRAVVDTSRPIGFTINAPGHKGAVAFGKLCPTKRREVSVALPPAASPGAPPAPLVLQEDCG